MLQSDLEYSSCYNISVGTVCSKSLVFSEYDMKIGLDVLGMHMHIRAVSTNIMQVFLPYNTGGNSSLIIQNSIVHKLPDRFCRSFILCVQELVTHFSKLSYKMGHYFMVI